MIKLMKSLVACLILAGSLSAYAGLTDDSFVIVSGGLNGMPNESMGEVSYGVEAGKNLYSGQDYAGFLSLGLGVLGTPSMKPLTVGLPFVDMVPYLTLLYGWEFMRNNVLSWGLDVSYGVGWLNSLWYSVNSGGVFGKWNLDDFSVLLRAGACGHNKEIGFNTNFGPYAHLGVQFNL